MKWTRMKLKEQSLKWLIEEKKNCMWEVVCQIHFMNENTGNTGNVSLENWGEWYKLYIIIFIYNEWV